MANHMKRRELKASLAVPSTVHTYSVVTEYIRDWFLAKWSREYFKKIHVEGKHVFDDYRNFDFNKVLKVKKPAVAIIPRLELEYNRDFLDTNMFGLNHLIDSGRLKQALMKDFDRNIFVGHAMKQLDLNYTFKIRVSSRANQIETYEYMSMAFRVGHRYTEEVNMDFHIPYKLMIQMAKDAGYEILEDERGNEYITDIVDFLNYANSISELPIIFKLRTVNHKMEFFVRFNDLEIIVDIPDRISADDGERQGSIDSNFHLEMNVNVKAPSPKFYVYYSIFDQDIDVIEQSVFPNPIYANNSYETVLTKFPKTDSNGWNQYLLTEYMLDKEDTDENGVTTIELKELFKSLKLIKIIKMHIETNIDSSNYISFHIQNGLKDKVPYTIDWDEMKLIISEELKADICKFGLYMDTEYINEMKNTINNMKKNRYNLERTDLNR